MVWKIRIVRHLPMLLILFQQYLNVLGLKMHAEKVVTTNGSLELQSGGLGAYRIPNVVVIYRAFSNNAFLGIFFSVFPV